MCDDKLDSIETRNKAFPHLPLPYLKRGHFFPSMRIFADLSCFSKALTRFLIEDSGPAEQVAPLSNIPQGIAAELLLKDAKEDSAANGGFSLAAA